MPRRSGFLVVWQLTGATFALALFAGSRGGAYGSVAATTVALAAIAAAAAWCAAARLPAEA